ncbi:uncharacterized protein LOC109823321 [Asparagus officinalis]|uniref:uncharacterized protein LOC109823321 n=1 Tax=Asparagus officinalis TaxID=4686 RepID=UPI00098E5842|nr:uncharacterized protein LOC109823321 [Asparagus officinalis]
MGYLVNQAQSAFVRGRNISSNILMAHELVKHYNRKHISPRIMLSLDIKKAFDTINWNFLNDMLTGLGFPEKMINWIMVCISSPKFSISLNGTLHGYFKGKRGLRQGDPLSPYLFILGMEYLSRSLDMLQEDRSFKYHPRCSELKITHLIFADDLLLLSKGDLLSVRKLFKCFKDFSDVSGLQANHEKSRIFYGGVDEEFKSTITTFLGFPEGRLEIIKSIALGIQIYWQSNYLLPRKVLQKIDDMSRDSLWGKYDQAHKNPLVSWDKVCLNKRNGGLGIFSAAIWNMAATLNILWNIHVKKENLWIKWIHGTYLKHNADIWQIQAKNGDSWMWKQILKVRDKALVSYGGTDCLGSALFGRLQTSPGIPLLRLKPEITSSLSALSRVILGTRLWTGCILGGNLAAGGKSLIGIVPD